MTLKTRIKHINSEELSNQKGWGDMDTHFAFAMWSKIDLVIVSADRTSNNQIVMHAFAKEGPGNEVQNMNGALVGVYINNNHYIILFA